MTSGFLADKPEFVEWVRKSHAFVMWDSVEFFQIGDAEVEWKILTPPAGDITVRRFVRSQDDGIDFRSARWLDVEKYLTWVLGSTVRNYANLPDLLVFPIPYKPEYLAPGFNLEYTQPKYSLTWKDAEGSHSVHQIGDIDAVEFSLYQHLTAAQLRQSFEDPDGFPLLQPAK